MEKDRKTRVIAIMALCVAVVGLSIGFAAFTRDLNIQFSDSNINISGDLNVKILASEDPEDTSTIINVEPLNDGITGTPATITNDRTTISGASLTFGNNGGAGMYSFYVYNNSEYDAYLKSVEFLNYPGADKHKICTALEGTNQDMVDAACGDIFFLIGADFDGDNNVGENEFLDYSLSNISSIKIPKGEILVASFAFAYDTVDSHSAPLPNGDFKINFGDIKLNFSSLEG